MLALAVAIGGWQGLLLFMWQALVAVWQLELTNYVCRLRPDQNIWAKFRHGT